MSAAQNDARTVKSAEKIDGSTVQNGTKAADFFQSFVFVVALTGIVLLFGETVFASSVGYTRSQSSTQGSDKVRITHGFLDDFNAALSYRKSKTTSVVDDPNSDSARATLTYTTESDHSFSCGVAMSDESYFFEGRSLTAGASFSLSELDRVNLGVELGQKVYTKARAESLLQRTFDVGYEREVSESLHLGFDIAVNSYAGQSVQTSRAVSGQTTTVADLESFSAILPGSSYSVFGEFSFGDFDFGAAVGVDTTFIGGARSSSFELSTDWAFSESWSSNLSLTRMRNDISATSIVSVSGGITYLF